MGFGSVFDDVIGSGMDMIFPGSQTHTAASFNKSFDENNLPDTLKKTILSSVISDESIGDNIIEQTINSGYRKVLNSYNKFVGIKNYNVYELIQIAEAVFPQSSLDDPRMPTPTARELYSVSRAWSHYGAKSLPVWLLDELQTRHTNIHSEACIDKTIEKNTWVAVSEYTFYLPGAESSYRSTLLNSDLSDQLFVHWIYPSHPDKPSSTNFSTVSQLPDMILFNQTKEEEVTTTTTDPDTGEETTTTTTQTVPVEPHAVVTYLWKDNGTVMTEEEVIPIPQSVLDDNKLYWILKGLISYRYSTEVIPSSTYSSFQDEWFMGYNRYYFYEDGAGIHPDLDEFSSKDTNSYLDMNYIRPLNVIWSPFGEPDRVINPTDGVTYDLIVDDFKAWQMDFDDIASSVANSVDLTDHYNSCFTTGVSFNATDESEILYLFLLFKHWYDTIIPDTFNSETDFLAEKQMTVGMLSPTRYYYFSGISQETVTGVYPGLLVGKSTRVDGPFTEAFVDDNGETFATNTWNGTKFIRQVSANTYIVMRVGIPQLLYRAGTNVMIHINPDDDRFILPLHETLLNQLGPFNAERIIYKNFGFLYIASRTVQLSWNETEGFADLMQLFQVGLLVSSAIVGIPAIMASYQVNVVVAALMYSALQYGISELLAITIKELGIENSLILAAVTIAAAAVSGYMDTSYLGGLLDARVFLSLANGLTQGIGTRANELAQEYQSKTQEFQLQSEEKWEELEEIRDLLDTETLLDPFTFIGKRPLNIPGESPQSFYERTIHSGNIGTMVYDKVHNFVADSLRLPTIEDTLGDTFYG